MLINFPNQLTSEEEQLLKKIAKMKKKKKIYTEKKTQLKESQNELQQQSTASLNSTTLSSTSLTSKKPGASTQQIDAKEAAKKLIQSGAIKLETENKSKGFKRSCSRKDDLKKINPSSSGFQDSPGFEANRQISYSSITNSPNFTKSPTAFPSPSYGANKLSYSTASSDNQYGQSPNYNNPNRTHRRMNSFNSYNQSPNNSDGGGSTGQGPMPGNGMPNFKFQKRPYFNNNQNQDGSVSLFIKANNVTEDILRSAFNANVSQVKVLSIDVKTNFAFISVESKESAETAISELNGKTFQDILFSVSIARPRKTFVRNNTYGSNTNYDRNNYGSNNYSANNPFNYNNNSNVSVNNSNNNASYSSANSDSSVSPMARTNPQSDNSSAATNRQMINYDDI